MQQALPQQTNLYQVPLHHLVSVWVDRLKSADHARKDFMDTAKICDQFFRGTAGFMWDSTFRNRYLGGLNAPKFQITIAKAFELVSVIGPALMWDSPGRICHTYRKLELNPAAFGPLGDPNAELLYQQFMQQYEYEHMQNEARCEFMEKYLNYAQREQPGGGLKMASHLGVIEGLVKGRGCLWTEPWESPVGTLTGSFWESVDKLYIDPDSKMANLADAHWIARKHEDKFWEVERRFGWKPGSLKKYANAESVDSVSRKSTAEDEMWRRVGQTADTIVWYEIFSKCGIGTRLSPVLGAYHDAFEQEIGDFAYICVVKGMPCPLNLSHEFFDVATPDQMRQTLDWPVPYYRDNRWPVSLLDFYPSPNCPWPIAPLSMGLGELVLMNVMVSSLADRIYRDGLTKTAILKDAGEDIVKKILSYDHEVFELNPAIAPSVNDLVSRIKSDAVSYDYFKMLDYISMSFDKRTGLMELLYGLNQGGKVTRTAEDAANKMEAVSVRPEWMRRRVEDWQTDAANAERIAAGWNVKGESLTTLFGPAAMLWDTLIASEDPKVFVSDMRSTIEANALKKPNKEKEAQNMQTLSGYMLPMLQWYMESTGDSGPVNAFLKSVGNSLEQDTTSWMIPPIPQPQPDPMQQAVEQQQLATGMATDEAKLQNARMKNDKLAHELLEMGAGLPPEAMAQMSMGGME